MDNGETLLITIIKNRLKEIYSTSDTDDNNLTSLASIASELENDVEFIKYINEDTIDAILVDNQYENHLTFKKHLLKIKELVKKDKKFRNKIKNNDAFSQTMVMFKRFLKIYLTNQLGEQISDEGEATHLNEILSQIKKNEAISNLDLIDKITMAYDSTNFESNMLTIVKYINNHNLNIYKNAQNEVKRYDLGHLSNKELDDRIKTILKILDISFTELPNALKKEIKLCDIDEVYETFELARKTKEERYGLLHLINEDNYLTKLCIILFGTPHSIRTVVDSLRDEDGNLYLDTIQNVLNCVPSSLMVKNNSYISPQFDNYVNNINYVKSIGVSHRSLISRAPLFMISNHELISETTNYLEMLGANKKTLTNKCYKTLAINPSLIATNADVLLKKCKIDFNEYLKQDNYNLLKVTNLEKKINIVIKENKNVKKDDYENINKLLITKIYTDCIKKNKVWSEV